MMRIIIKTLPALLCSTVLSHAVMAQDVINTAPMTPITKTNRASSEPIPVYTINRQVDDLVGSQVPQVTETLEAGLTARLSDLEETVRQLTGQIEQQNYQLQKLQSELQAKTQSNQVNNVEKPAGVAAYSGSSEIGRTIKESKSRLATSSSENLVENQVAAAVTPDALYSQGYSLVQDGQYEKAAQIFETFLKKYPTHNLADNSRYWLAETHYVRQDFGLAAEEFLKVYENNPKGNKAADSLLKLSLSLGNLGSKDEACVTLDKLKEEYPNPGRSISDRIAKEETELGCS